MLCLTCFITVCESGSLSPSSCWCHLQLELLLMADSLEPLCPFALQPSMIIQGKPIPSYPLILAKDTHHLWSPTEARRAHQHSGEKYTPQEPNGVSVPK